MTSNSDVPSAARKRRAKTMLTPSMKYEIWLQVIRGEVTIAQAAATARVDRSTIIRVRQVAKDGGWLTVDPFGRWRRTLSDSSPVNADIRRCPTTGCVFNNASAARSGPTEAMT